MDLTTDFINRLYNSILGGTNDEDKDEFNDNKSKEMVINLAKYREDEKNKTGIKRDVFKTSIQRSVDTSIYKHLQASKPITYLQTHLSEKMVDMKCALSKIDPNYNFDPKIFDSEDWMDSVNGIRQQYFLYYIYFLNKRISDLQWILSNRYRAPKIKLSHLNNGQIFKLIKLKEKLDPKSGALV